MDYQNRVGSKKGAGGMASNDQVNLQRHQRIKNILLNSSSLQNDPYLIKNNLGHYECKLCLTTHVNEASYISHSQGKKHQLNLIKRSNLDNKKIKLDTNTGLYLFNKNGNNVTTIPKKQYVKIGKPIYKVTKTRDPLTLQLGLSIVVNYSNTKGKIGVGKPLYRIMSSFEQNKEAEKFENKNFKYLILHYEPFENICFKVPNLKIDDIWDFYDVDLKEYYIQIAYSSS
ncbi:hypothetical protein PACTADRAFT_48976 [Pachysolen tannophilus NRRL Y-2460]|uniref:U1-type domain-containing protein n=1 Tax=Pachysolen tannophilus NRRL Y-2460 TaxID=669874 RepID=A0A1E4TZR7_PACTA|nr:hypothetical protein PACTADRAFT_48976 [Pachysolen tannophilus NRRL Y-2460]